MDTCARNKSTKMILVHAQLLMICPVNQQNLSKKSCPSPYNGQKWASCAASPCLCTPGEGCCLKMLQLCWLPLHLFAPHQWVDPKMDAPLSPKEPPSSDQKLHAPSVHSSLAKLSCQVQMSPDDLCLQILWKFYQCCNWFIFPTYSTISYLWNYFSKH